MKCAHYVSTALTVFLLGICTSALAAEPAKDDPEYMRKNHAGVETMTVQRSLPELHSIIESGVNKCYAKRDNPLLSNDTKGVIAQSVVKRIVKSNIAADGKAGYILYAVKGFWLTPAFLFDLHQTDHGVEISFYYESDNKMQRSAYSNAQAWIKGDASVCAHAP